MGKVTGFMELDRVERDYEPVEDRIKHFKEFLVPLDEKKVSEQGARCMKRKKKFGKLSFGNL